MPIGKQDCKELGCQKDPRGQQRPADVIGNAVKVMKIATGETAEDVEDDGKDRAAQSLGQRGGGARAGVLSPERRKQIAESAASARWGSKKKSKVGSTKGMASTALIPSSW